jgi:hypothetical protein
VHIAWNDLGLVLAVGLVLGAGVAALYAVGVRALAPADGTSTTGGRALAYSCFVACAAAVLYGLYVLLF